jgi:hypothetical protein
MAASMSPFAEGLSHQQQGREVALLQRLLADLGHPVAEHECREQSYGGSTILAVQRWRAAESEPAMQPEACEGGELSQDDLSKLWQQARSCKRVVQGTITLADGTPVPGLRVTAFDRDFRSELLLGKARTNAEGQYRITYTALAALRAEKASADLGLRIHTADGKTLLHASGSSELVMNAPAEARLDRVVDLPPGALPNAFDELVAALQPLIGKVPIAAIQADPAADEGLFLARELQQEVSTLTHLVVAHRLQELAEVPAAYSFAVLEEDGLFGIGPSRPRVLLTPVTWASDTRTVLFALVLLEPEAAKAALERAVRRHRVSPALLRQFPSIQKQLERWRSEAEQFQKQGLAERILDGLDERLAADQAGDLLRLFGPFDPQTLDELRERLNPPPPTAGKEAKPVSSSRLELSALLGHHLGLVEEVAESLGADSPADLQRLAQLERKDWSALISKGNVRLGGAPIPKALARRQASLIVRRFERRFPTAAFSAQLARRQPEEVPQAAAVAALLDAHPDFDLSTHRLRPFLRAADEDPQALDATVLEAAETLQRLFQLTGSYRKSEGLLKAGFRSSADIVAAGRSNFIEAASSQAGMEPSEAEAVFATASQRNVAALMLATELRSLSQPMGMEAAATSTALSGQLAAIVADQPDLRVLFGSNNACACRHCRSIYGPAAYLADVVRFLSKRRAVDTTSAGASINPKDVLFKRRPDLGEIDLNCANAETPVPHIDIVCELLEEAIAPDTGFSFTGAISAGRPSAALLAAIRTAGFEVADTAVIYGNTPTPPAPAAPPAPPFHLRDPGLTLLITSAGPNTWTLRRLRQTHGSAAERAAAPEYVNATAYAALAAAGVKTAFDLPFDLPHLEVRAFLGAMEIQRQELMAALATSAAPAAELIAAESLGLAPAERTVVTTAAVSDQPAVWGVSGSAASPSLDHLDRFTIHTGLNYSQVVDLIALPWVRGQVVNLVASSSDPWLKGGVNLFIRHLDTSCDLAQKLIVNLNDTVLDRVHRLLRLSRRTGIAPFDLDRLAVAPTLGNRTLGDPALLALATLRGLSVDLSVPVEELITWLDVIPTGGSPSAHGRLFQNPVATGPLDPGLAPPAIEANEITEAATPGNGRKLDALRANFCLVWGISDEDFTKLHRHLMAGHGGILPGGAAPILSRVALAAIHGRVGLAMALGWSITDLLGLERLLGVNPLASANNLKQLVGTARQLQTFGISSVELRSRLEAPAAGQLPPWALAESAITSRLQALQATLLQAQKQHVSPYQENLETLEQLETLERALQTVPAVGNDAITAIRELLRAETPSTAQVSASKAVVDGPLVGLVQAATIKGRIDALAAATNEAGREVERQAIIQLILRDLAAAALLQEARQATANALVDLLALSGEQAEVLLDRLTLTVGGSTLPLAELFIPQAWLSGSTTPTPWLAGTVSPASTPNLYRAIRLAQAVVGLLPISSLTPEVLEVLLRQGDALHNQGWLRLRDVPFEPSIPPISLGRWLVLRAGLALLERFPAVQDPARPGSTVSALDLLQLALTSSTTKAQLLSSLALVTGWPLARLQVLDSHYALALADYAKPATWAQLETAVSLLHRLGTSLPEALTLAAGTLNTAASQLARRLLRARYDEAEWLPALKSLMDPIRERKRDALITHLLAINPGLKSRLDVYDVFLTDPEWSARMPSSRLVQAHSTVQLFIRRCLEGLEPKAVADLSDQDWKQWEWMKNYRVWEVARKVFVDAQYYLKPEWRDDKTEIFAEFESTLQQKELNEENVNAAFEGYLDRLDQIAFLDVLATCYDLQNYSLHVIAATKGGEPRLYFHRRLDRERFWTPWTKIDLDISGDHLIAFFRNQRLHLAWATFVEKGNEEQSLPFPQQGSGNQPLPRAQRRLEISLAVSEFTGKRWLPRRVSRDAITTPWAEEPIDRATLQLTVNPDPERFTVDLYRNPGAKEVLRPIGSFLLTGCKGYPEVRQFAGAPVWLLPQFENTTFNGQRLKEIDPSNSAVEVEQDLAIQGGFGGFGSAVLFNRTPGIFRVSYPYQSTDIDRWINWLLALYSSRFSDYRFQVFGTGMPFFFEDNLRGYILVPGWHGPLDQDGNRTTAKTFSNLHKLVVDIETFIQIYIKRWNSATTAQQKAAVWDEFIRDPELARIVAEITVYANLPYRYEVRNFYHPRLCFLRQRFFQGGISLLLSRESQLAKGSFDFGNASTGYGPSSLIAAPYPVEELEFGVTSAYAAYNWELTFHAPHLMASMLMAAQRYDEAETWLRTIFDPRGLAGDPALQGDPTRARYWMTKPFYQRSSTDYTNQRIDRIFNRLANDPTGATETELVAAVDQWRREPFKPYLIARSRTVAFQQAIVHLTARLYLERGDQSFRRDSLEDLVMATLDYSRAERLLGPRPQVVPRALEVPPETYNQLDARLDAFGNALCRLENLLPDVSVLPQGGAELPSSPPAPSAPPINFASLYFCIPPSEKLFELWDTLAERQFNLRNSRTIDGVERDLSLFAPPLSVEALIQASAAGLSIGEILSSLSAPMPPYRFRVMLRHAIDLASVAAGFSQKLEQALASADGEGLQRLRSDHEGRLLREQQETMRQEIQAAINAVASARKGKQMHEESQQFYAARPYMNAWEIAATASYGASLALQAVVAIGYAASGGLSLIPNFMIGAAGFGGSPTVNAQTGGREYASSARDFVVGAVGALGAALDKAGSMLSQQGSFQVRHEDWENTARNYQREIERAEIEIQTTLIRQRIAEEQLRVQQIRSEQQAAEATYLRSKFTNRELYDWMVGQLQGLSRELHKLATEASKAAERCYQYELGVIDAFIKPGHWQDYRKGLLAADRLQADLRRMETTYHQRHRRELELTTHVSLARLDPIALLELRTSGKCIVQIPEAFFDLEQPGHYFRRIKSLSISVPCVVSPQGSVALKVTQTSNRLRMSTTLQSGLPAGSDPYAEDPGNDPRFRYNVGSVQSITLSRGLEDAGLFSVNLEDDRYLPFEGTGAIGTYALELPGGVTSSAGATRLRTFDYSSIADVVFHVRYTARDGGGSFRSTVQSNLKTGLNQMILKTGRTGLFHAFDIRRDHPGLWHRLISTGNDSFILDRNWLPYFIGSQGVSLNVLSLRLLAKFASGAGSPTLSWNGGAISLNPAADPALAGFSSGAAPAGVTFGSSVALSTNSVGQQRIRELLLIVNYSV